MATTSVSTVEIRQRAWSGTDDELRVLAHCVADEAGRFVPEDELLGEHRLTVSLKDSDLDTTVSGGVDDAFESDDISMYRLRSVDMRAGRTYRGATSPSLVLYMDGDGVRLKVTAPKAEAVRSAAVLERQLRVNRPWWSLLSDTQLVLGAVAALAFVHLFVRWAIGDLEEAPSSSVSTLVLGVGIVGAGLAALVYFQRLLFPALEVWVGDTKPISKRLRTGAGVLMLGVVASAIWGLAGGSFR